jgi:predicted secreted protein
MGPITALSIFLVTWWVVLFTILPLGVTSHAEAGVDRGDGGDPGAPVEPKLKRKFITTTIVSAVIWTVIMLCLQFKLIPLPNVPMI